jgi:micrococcal nuclease
VARCSVGGRRAAPLRRAAPRHAKRRAPYRASSRGSGISPILVVGPLAAFAAVFLWDGPPFASGVPLPAGRDGEAAFFARCSGPLRTDCVVDGDTFWYPGEKIRIADIDTPELSSPECGEEARLAERATLRLTELLNAGPFALEPVDRETDRCGRTPRIVTRGGESLGERLVADGLAERWQGFRGGWG